MKNTNEGKYLLVVCAAFCLLVTLVIANKSLFQQINFSFIAAPLQSIPMVAQNSTLNLKQSITKDFISLTPEDVIWPNPEFHLTHFDSISSSTLGSASDISSKAIYEVWNWMPLVGIGGNTKNSSLKTITVFANPPSLTCTQTFTYSGVTNPKGGLQTNACSDGTSDSKPNYYNMVVGYDTYIGSDSFTDTVSGKTLYSAQNGRTTLILKGDSSFYYSMGIYFNVYRVRLTNADGSIETLEKLSCSQTSVQGQVMNDLGNGHCYATVVGRGNSTVDITPSSVAKYYWYGMTFDSGTAMEATSVAPSDRNSPSISYAHPLVVSAGSSMSIFGGNFDNNDTVRLMSGKTKSLYIIYGQTTDRSQFNVMIPGNVPSGSYNVQVSNSKGDMSNVISVTIVGRSTKPVPSKPLPAIKAPSLF